MHYEKLQIKLKKAIEKLKMKTQFARIDVNLFYFFFISFNIFIILF